MASRKRNDLATPTIVGLLTNAGSFTTNDIQGASKNWLLDEALKRSLISLEQRNASLEEENIVLKRYLRTGLDVKKHPKLVTAIDNYVAMASCIKAAGTQLLNLFAIHSYDAGLFDGGFALDAAGRVVRRPSCEKGQFVNDTFLDQTFVKYALLPFKSAVSRTAEGIPSVLADVWQTIKDVLIPTYPDVCDLRAVAWDQPLSDMAREMCGAIKAHVTTHLGVRLASYLRSIVTKDMLAVVRTDRATRRTTITVAGSTFFAADMYELLERNKETPDIPQGVKDIVAGLRMRAGLEGSARLSKIRSLTDARFKLHIELSREAERRLEDDWAARLLDNKKRSGRQERARSFSACPVAKTHRCFAYIDDRIIESILKRIGTDVSTFSKPKCSLFEAALGVDCDSWNQASKAARRARRNSKHSKKKASLGWGRYPPRDQGWRATSASTDGVAICVTLARPLPKVPPTCTLPPPPPPHHSGGSSSPSHEVPSAERHLIATDEGRVVLFEAAQKAADGSWVSSRLTRRQYQRWSLQDRHTSVEKQRREERPDLRAAIDSLSQGTWRTTSLPRFTAMIRIAASVHATLKREYVTDSWHARWRMLLWRRKRMVVMQSFCDTVRKVAPKGASIAFGAGDASFPSTGRGEKAVPTKSLDYNMWRASRSLRGVYDVEFHTLDESCTTMKCHGCHKMLDDVRNNDGYVLRGLKQCRSAQCVAGKPHSLEACGDASAGCGTCGRAYAPLHVDGNRVEGLAVCCHAVETTACKEQATRLLNRDRNAARNIWEVLYAEVHGLPRPTYLKKASRRVKRSG